MLCSTCSCLLAPSGPYAALTTCILEPALLPPATWYLHHAPGCPWHTLCQVRSCGCGPLWRPHFAGLLAAALPHPAVRGFPAMFLQIRSALHLPWLWGSRVYGLGFRVKAVSQTVWLDPNTFAVLFCYVLHNAGGCVHQVDCLLCSPAAAPCAFREGPSATGWALAWAVHQALLLRQPFQPFIMRLLHPWLLQRWHLLAPPIICWPAPSSCGLPHLGS